MRIEEKDKAKQLSKTVARRRPLDQSGFQFEVHSGRTLAIEEESQVECLVQSVASTTHSYTIQPTISGDEKTGEFGPVVSQELFRPANI
ncbi:hypothetical protein TSAR_003415 [Trichomalopsis sarcophagae]|uniref:Uncharacterized protein n=1 Tax=Trichomalopsis sarcophagae TaxID=543379 RepID=A0A232FID2_9HYME|nr:hypothetical protein TSAR_003415 [Trichomalopsis sarcophagae]